MFKYALVAVWSLGLGVLLRDVAQDWLDLEKEPALIACKADRENAARYAQALTHLLNGGKVSLPGTEMQCRVKHIKVKS
jgi:hypothetical protein